MPRSKLSATSPHIAISSLSEPLRAELNAIVEEHRGKNGAREMLELAATLVDTPKADFDALFDVKEKVADPSAEATAIIPVPDYIVLSSDDEADKSSLRSCAIPSSNTSKIPLPSSQTDRGARHTKGDPSLGSPSNIQRRGLKRSQSPHSNSPPRRKGSKHMWVCPECHSHNFPNKLECYNCPALREDYGNIEWREMLPAFERTKKPYAYKHLAGEYVKKD